MQDSTVREVIAPKRAGTVRNAIAFASLVLALSASVAHATPVTFDFSGTTNDGLSLTGKYTFDDATVDNNSAATRGTYNNVGAPFLFEVNVGGQLFSLDRTSIQIALGTQTATGLSDSYRAAAVAASGSISLQLTYDHGGVLVDDTLPLAPPSLTGLIGNRFDVTGFGLERAFTGTINSLTCATCGGGEAPPSTSVPEPATFGLLAIGMAPMLLIRRRKQRSRDTRVAFA